jgi:DNA-directed RNA polymerase subunit N (RpoN/RPB10)
MIIPVRCFSCNEPLANVWEYFKRRQKELKQKGVLECKVVFEELDLPNMCCRRHLLGQVDLVDII